jgi:hypothetical protein
MGLKYVRDPRLTAVPCPSPRSSASTIWPRATGWHARSTALPWKRHLSCSCPSCHRRSMIQHWPCHGGGPLNSSCMTNTANLVGPLLCHRRLQPESATAKLDALILRLAACSKLEPP